MSELSYMYSIPTLYMTPMLVRIPSINSNITNCYVLRMVFNGVKINVKRLFKRIVVKWWILKMWLKEVDGFYHTLLTPYFINKREQMRL